MKANYFTRITKKNMPGSKWVAGLGMAFTLSFLGTTGVHAQDVGATALVVPTSPMCAAINQTVTVTIKNYDVATIDFSTSNVTVVVNVTGASTQFFNTTVNTGTLAPGASQDVIVTTAADLSAAGINTFDARTVFFLDANTANDAMSTVNIMVNPLPLADANSTAADTNVCMGMSAVFTASGGDAYQWRNDVGDTVSTVATVTVSPTVDKTYWVRVTDNTTSCYAWDSVMVHVNALPAADANSTAADTNVCMGMSAVFTASGGDAYQWRNDIGDTVSTAATVTVSPTVDKTYWVRVTNNTTSCYAWDSVMVHVNALPAADANSTAADTNVCMGMSAVFTASGGDAYQWINTLGDTVSTVATVTVSPTVDKTYWVRVTDNTTSCYAWDSVKVHVNALPAADANSTAADTSICAGMSATFTASGGDAYQWRNDVGDTISTAAAVTVSPTVDKTYWVRVTDNTTSCYAWDSVMVTINPLDLTVSLNADTATANQAGATYQWLNCDNANAAIAGETNQTFVPAVDGNYAVIVNNGTCADTSACQFIVALGVKSAGINAIQTNIYPNPGKGLYNVQIAGNKIQTAGIKVYNAVGELVYQASINGQYATIDLTNQNDGIYLVQVITSAGISQQRIMKQ